MDQVKKIITTSVPTPANPIILVDSITSSSIELSSQAVVPLVLVFEKIKARVLASTLKMAIMVSTDPLFIVIRSKAKKAIKEIIMRKEKYCK